MGVVSDMFLHQLRIWIFWTASNLRTPPATFKNLSEAVTRRIHMALSSPLKICSHFGPQSVLAPAPFLPAPILIFNNLGSISIFAFISLPHFVVQSTQFKCFLNLCIPSNGLQFGSNKTLSYSYCKVFIIYINTSLYVMGWIVIGLPNSYVEVLPPR